MRTMPLTLAAVLLLSGCGAVGGPLSTHGGPAVQAQTKNKAFVVKKLEREQSGFGTFHVTMEVLDAGEKRVLVIENVDEQHGTRWHWVTVNGKYLTDSEAHTEWLGAFADRFDAATASEKQGLAVQLRFYLRKKPTVWGKEVWGSDGPGK